MVNWKIIKSISKKRNIFYVYVLLWSVILGFITYNTTSLKQNILILIVFSIGFIIGDIQTMYKQYKTKINLEIKNGKGK